MILNDTLEGLARRLGTMTALKSAQVWQGPWDATQSPARASLSTPAALVSLGGLQLVSLGHTIAGRRDLVTPGQRRQPPTAFQPAPAVRPLANVEIAVTLVSAAPGAGRRAAVAVDLVEQVLLVLVAQALVGIEGTNLDSDALRQAGLSAFVLVGTREVELAPVDPARVVPARVDVAADGARARVYPERAS